MFAVVDAYNSSIFNSYIEMIEKYAGNTQDETIDTDNSINYDFEVVVPLEPNDNFLKLISKMTHISDISLTSKANNRGICSYIEDFSGFLFESGNTIELGDMLFFDAIKFCETLSKENIDGFFGLLLMDSYGKIINPFHPLISLAIQKEFSRNSSSHIFREKFRTIVFSLNTERKNIFNEFSKDAYANTIIDNIAHQMICYDEAISIVNRKTVSSNVADLIQSAKNGIFQSINLLSELKYKSNHNIEMKGLEFGMLVPVQIAVKGIAMPWYGSVVAYRGRPNNGSLDTYGVQLSPFLSANVGFSGNELTKKETVFDGVCCGNYDKTKPEGIYTLNRANFDSALNNYAVECGWMIHKNECIKASLEVYSSFIEFDRPKPKKLTYKEQWLLDNPTMTEIDYLAHLRTKHAPISNIETHIPNPMPQAIHPNDVLLNQIFNGLHDDSADALSRSIFGADFANAIDTGIQAIIEAGVRDAESEAEPVKRKRRKRNPETGILE